MECIFLRILYKSHVIFKRIFFFFKEEEWEKVQVQTTLLSFAIERSREMGQEVEGDSFKSSFEQYADENNLTKGKADDAAVNLPKWRGEPGLGTGVDQLTPDNGRGSRAQGTDIAQLADVVAAAPMQIPIPLFFSQ